MARYRMDDGTILDTKNATQSWDDDTRHDGSNNISVATGSQWTNETLHRSRKGRFWIEFLSREQFTPSRARWVDKREATAWLIMNNCDVPPELTVYVDAVSE